MTRSDRFAEINVGERTRSKRIRHHVRRAERWMDAYYELWWLNSKAPAVAKLIFSLLIHHKIPEIRAGALCGLIEMRKVRANLAAFRLAAKHRSSIVRDAGIWGLSQSTSPADERTLWRALWRDSYLEIRASAAYALRVMRRQISVERFREAMTTYKYLDLRLELAERGLTDRRLRGIAQKALHSILPQLQSSDLLTPDRRELLRRLQVKVGRSRVRKR